MNEKENNDPSIIDEIIKSLDINEKKKMKIKKRKKGSKKNRKADVNNKEIEKICRENKSNDAYAEKISLYKVNKEDVKEEYDIIMDCDNSDYIIYQKRK